ncbi:MULTISPECIES: hypothetical protein [unclassified Micromonospora]|uniref:hypothetical protein n=1 Tax=unclassified Micromonospora TaxID=2617518 RepID=UPI0033AEA16C
MASRAVRSGVVAALCLLAMLAGCSGDPSATPLAKGCHPPAHEDELLAAYLAEPVFAFRPPEALAVGPPAVEKGCRQVGERESTRIKGQPVDAGPGVTTTRVSLFFALDVGFAQDKLAEMYEPAILAAGWKTQPLDLAPVHSSGDGQAGLYYCKDVNGVPSFLSVYERWVGTTDGRAFPVSPSPEDWPEAGSLEVTVTAVRGVRCTTP